MVAKNNIDPHSLSQSLVIADIPDAASKLAVLALPPCWAWLFLSIPDLSWASFRHCSERFTEVQSSLLTSQVPLELGS